MTFQTSISAVAFVPLLFLTLLYCVFKKLRNARPIVFQLTWLSAASQFWVLVGSIVGPRNFLCKSSVESTNQNDGANYCHFQGALMQFTALALCSWWLCLCWDLSLIINKATKHGERGLCVRPRVISL